MPQTNRAKNCGEDSIGKSKSGDGQFFLIEEIDSKNNPINRVMAPYAETCRDILRKNIRNMLNVRRWKLSKLTEIPDGVTRVSNEVINTVAAAACIKHAGVTAREGKAEKIGSV